MRPILSNGDFLILHLQPRLPAKFFKAHCDVSLPYAWSNHPDSFFQDPTTF